MQLLEEHLDKLDVAIANEFGDDDDDKDCPDGYDAADSPDDGLTYSGIPNED